jgi:hypothetical protein
MAAQDHGASDDIWTIEIRDFPVALVTGQTIVVNGRAVARVDETHICFSRAELEQYVRDHPI